MITEKIINFYRELSPEFKKIRNWLVIVLLLCLTFVGNKYHVFTSMEMTHLDAMLRIYSRAKSDRIVLVKVTDKDYRDPELFYGNSPVDRYELVDLVQAVKDYKPKVIGVDFDTTDWNQACLKKKTGTQQDHLCAAQCAKLDAKLERLLKNEDEPQTASTAIVWAAVPESSNTPLEIHPVLGGKPGAAWGVPRFPVDADGAVRHYENLVESKGVCRDHENGECYAPTFMRAVVDRYQEGRGQSSPDGLWARVMIRLRNGIGSDELILNFSGDRDPFPILEAGSLLDKQTQKTAILEENRKRILRNRIVLIGGSYKEARDQYFTPLGLKTGVELNALAIQSELSGGGSPHLSEKVQLFIDLCVAWFIVWLFVRYKPRIALRWSFATLLLLFIASMFVFQTFSFWFNVVPIAFGVVGHQLYELAKKSQELEVELNAIKSGPQKTEVIVTEVERVIVIENRAPAVNVKPGVGGED